MNDGYTSCILSLFVIYCHSSLLYNEAMDKTDSLSVKLEVINMACEKAVKLVQDLEARVKRLEQDNATLRNEVNNLQATMATVANDVAVQTANTGIAAWHAQADEDLYEYQMSVKDDTGPEMPVSNKEIQDRAKSYWDQRKAREMRQLRP